PATPSIPIRRAFQPSIPGFSSTERRVAAVPWKCLSRPPLSASVRAMPLSDPAPRESLHTRHVECRGFKRDDGLWDIEGHMTDVKSYVFINRWRGEIPVGTPLNEMWVRITV